MHLAVAFAAQRHQVRGVKRSVRRHAARHDVVHLFTKCTAPRAHGIVHEVQSSQVGPCLTLEPIRLVELAAEPWVVLEGARH